MSTDQNEALHFGKKNIGKTVEQLRARAAHLAEALEWTYNQDEASPMESELRIINATLSAIAVEYGPNYFPTKGDEQLAAPTLTPDPTPGKLTFELALAAYRALLEQQPGKALRTDSYNIAFMLDGEMVGYYDGDGVVDVALIYDHDRSAWDDERGCWASEVDETQGAIDNPVYVDIPVFS